MLFFTFHVIFHNFQIYYGNLCKNLLSFYSTIFLILLKSVSRNIFFFFRCVSSNFIDNHFHPRKVTNIILFFSLTGKKGRDGAPRRDGRRHTDPQTHTAVRESWVKQSGTKIILKMPPLKMISLFLPITLLYLFYEFWLSVSQPLPDVFFLQFLFHDFFVF